MGESLNSIYGKKLIHLRTILLIKQEEMAAKFNITQQAYGQMEKGKTNFTVKKIEKICEIFNITVQDFITLEVPTLQVKTKDTDSVTITILKKHHEIALLEKDIRIGELEIENKYLRGNKKPIKDPAPVYVMI